MSIPTDAAKKKLLKKLAKELGYKLEDAIFKNIGGTVNENIENIAKNAADIAAIQPSNYIRYHFQKKPIACFFLHNFFIQFMDCIFL